MKKKHKIKLSEEYKSLYISVTKKIYQALKENNCLEMICLQKFFISSKAVKLKVICWVI